jgi:hypothetical protein
MVDHNRDRNGDAQDDETTDDSNHTMSDYTFIQTDDEEADNSDNTENFTTVGNKWNLGEHSTTSEDEQNSLAETISATVDELDDDVDEDLVGVLQDAQNLVDSTNVSRFECPHEDCGLGHSHPDHKHDIRSAFNVEDSFAEQMEFTPYCHCAANEMAMLIQFFPYISESVFTDQHEFEGVLELEAGKLQDLISAVISGEMTPKKASLQVVEARNSAMRGDLQMFLDRVNSIQRAANAAPIASETRAIIEENREALDEQTSQ